MVDKLKKVFDKKIIEENEEFNTLQIAISTLMIQTAVYDGIFDEQVLAASSDENVFPNLTTLTVAGCRNLSSEFFRKLSENKNLQLGLKKLDMRRLPKVRDSALYVYVSKFKLLTNLGGTRCGSNTSYNGKEFEQMLKDKLKNLKSAFFTFLFSQT